MISTLGLALRTQKNVSTLQERLAKVQEQVSSTKISDTYSGLGGQVRDSVDMRVQFKKLDTYLSNIGRLQVDVNQMEQPLLEIADATNSVRDDLLAQANGTAPDMNAMKSAMSAAIDRMTGALNVNLNGRYSFSGTNVAQQPMGDSSGLQAQVKSIVAGYTDAADASAKYDQAVQYVMDNWNDFYKGDTGTSQLSGLVEDGSTFSFGVRGDDDAFKKTFAAMFVMNNVDYDAGNKDGYEAIRSKAVDGLQSGFQGTNAITGEWGRAAKRLDTLQTRYKDQQTLLNTRIGDVEDVDMAAKSVELTNLQSQLQTSYQLISMLKSMNLANYL